MIIREIDEGHCGGMGREPFCVHGEWGDGDGNGNGIRNSNLLTCGSEYNYEDEGPIGYGRKRPKKERKLFSVVTIVDPANQQTICLGHRRASCSCIPPPSAR